MSRLLQRANLCLKSVVGVGLLYLQKNCLLKHILKLFRLPLYPLLSPVAQIHKVCGDPHNVYYFIIIYFIHSVCCFASSSILKIEVTQSSKIPPKGHNVQWSKTLWGRKDCILVFQKCLLSCSTEFRSYGSLECHEGHTTLHSLSRSELLTITLNKS